MSPAAVLEGETTTCALAGSTAASASNPAMPAATTARRSELNDFIEMVSFQKSIYGKISASPRRRTARAVRIGERAMTQLPGGVSPPALEQDFREKSYPIWGLSGRRRLGRNDERRRNALVQISSIEQAHACVFDGRLRWGVDGERNIESAHPALRIDIGCHVAGVIDHATVGIVGHLMVHAGRPGRSAMIVHGTAFAADSGLRRAQKDGVRTVRGIAFHRDRQDRKHNQADHQAVDHGL